MKTLACSLVALELLLSFNGCTNQTQSSATPSTAATAPNPVTAPTPPNYIPRPMPMTGRY